MYLERFILYTNMTTQWCALRGAPVAPKTANADESHIQVIHRFGRCSKGCVSSYQANTVCSNNLECLDDEDDRRLELHLSMSYSHALDSNGNLKFPILDFGVSMY
jgi:hypothetical protein